MDYKGYSSHKSRRYLHRWRIGAIIPHQRNERRMRRFDRAAYRARNVVERTLNHLTQY